MGTDICFYFQVHQPWRLRHYRYLEVGKNSQYFDDAKNEEILHKVANKCYLPMNQVLLDLIRQHEGRFKVSFSITGTALEQMEQYRPEVIDSYRRLLDTGCVELISETSHHTLAALFSPEEFREQVNRHREICIRLLKTTPSKVFRNTELITSDAVAQQVADLGYEAMLMEGADHILRWRSPLFKYRMAAAPNLVALLKNYRLSDDIAFRFSDRNWAAWPLTAEKYVEWVRLIELDNAVSAKGGRPFIGLFMDYETFGEHQWADTGIFDFMRALPGQLFAGLPDLRFVTPTEAARLAREESQFESYQISAPRPFSWADVERDLSAWMGSPIQDSAFRAIYRLVDAAKGKAAKLDGQAKEELLETLRRLQTSDHFYYMCTKYFADGDVHKYFSPYESPYEAHILYMNVMADFARRCGEQPEIAEKSA